MLLWSCTTNPIQKEANDQLSEREVKSFLEQYAQAVSEKGLEAEFGFLDSSSTFFWIPPGFYSAISFDSVANILHGNAKLFSKINNRWDTLHVEMPAPEIAVYWGILNSESFDTSGNNFSARLIESGVVKKIKGKWKLHSGQTSIFPDSLSEN